MSEEMCYFIEVSFPIKITERESAWVKVNALRSPTQSGYHNGSDRVEMDEQMAEECANAINTMANKLRDKDLLPSHQSPRTETRQSGQSSLEGQESTNKPIYPTYKVMVESVNGDIPICPVCKEEGKMTEIDDKIISYCKSKGFHLAMCKTHQNQFWSWTEKKELRERYKQIREEYEHREGMKVIKI